VSVKTVFKNDGAKKRCKRRVFAFPEGNEERSPGSLVMRQMPSVVIKTVGHELIVQIDIGFVCDTKPGEQDCSPYTRGEQDCSPYTRGEQDCSPYTKETGRFVPTSPFGG
jgi:hypothetical protein